MGLVRTAHHSLKPKVDGCTWDQRGKWFHSQRPEPNLKVSEAAGWKNWATYDERASPGSPALEGGVGSRTKRAMCTLNQKACWQPVQFRKVYFSSDLLHSYSFFSPFAFGVYDLCFLEATGEYSKRHRSLMVFSYFWRQLPFSFRIPQRFG